LASAYGVITNSAPAQLSLDSITPAIIPVDSASYLDGMNVSGNSLCAQSAGYYIVSYGVSFVPNSSGSISVELIDAAGTPVPNSRANRNYPGSTVEESVNNSALVFLSAGECLRLAALAGGSIVVSVNTAGANITAYKIAQ
jgi:hypothetical protein